VIVAPLRVSLNQTGALTLTCAVLIVPPRRVMSMPDDVTRRWT
jgi:hypothetical protein